MIEETIMFSQPQKNDLERMQKHADSLVKEKKSHLRRISQMQTQIKELQERILYLETLDYCSTSTLSEIFTILQSKTDLYYSGMKAAFDDLLSRTQEMSDTIIIHSKEKAADILRKANEQVNDLQTHEEDTHPKKKKKKKKKKEKKEKKKK